ncbi:MAG: FkbM family methyltransferase [Chthoniobacterales bacterium]|nr:FkbM family methyltransferase [Chthoniobacterales bacterium]
MSSAANQFLKRVLPARLQRFIYRFLWNPVRDAYWARLKLGCELPSGLQVEIRNRSDWTIFTEVMVGEEYDRAIDFALSRRQAGPPFVVADLGGNVGYFTLRCADRFFRDAGSFDSLQIVLVEGSPVVFREVQRRISTQPPLKKTVTVRHGLVGSRRHGDAYIGGSHIHYSNVASTSSTPGAMRVPFIDLDREFSATAEIDLLKCDIEGAEFDFIEAYPALLRRVRAAVVEFHRYGRDFDSARAALHDCGLVHREVLRETAAISIEFYWR